MQRTYNIQMTLNRVGDYVPSHDEVKRVIEAAVEKFTEELGHDIKCRVHLVEDVAQVGEIDIRASKDEREPISPKKQISVELVDHDADSNEYGSELVYVVRIGDDRLPEGRREVFISFNDQGEWGIGEEY